MASLSCSTSCQSVPVRHCQHPMAQYEHVLSMRGVSEHDRGESMRHVMRKSTSQTNITRSASGGDPCVVGGGVHEAYYLGLKAPRELSSRWVSRSSSLSLLMLSSEFDSADSDASKFVTRETSAKPFTMFFRISLSCHIYMPACA